MRTVFYPTQSGPPAPLRPGCGGEGRIGVYPRSTDQVARPRRAGGQATKQRKGAGGETGAKPGESRPRTEAAKAWFPNRGKDRMLGDPTVETRGCQPP